MLKIIANDLTAALVRPRYYAVANTITFSSILFLLKFFLIFDEKIEWREVRRKWIEERAFKRSKFITTTKNCTQSVESDFSVLDLINDKFSSLLVCAENYCERGRDRSSLATRYTVAKTIFFLFIFLFDGRIEWQKVIKRSKAVCKVGL